MVLMAKSRSRDSELQITANDRCWRQIVLTKIYKKWRDLLFANRCILHAAILTYHEDLDFEA